MKKPMKKIVKKAPVKKGETVDDYKKKYFVLLEKLDHEEKQPEPPPKKEEKLFPDDDMEHAEMEELLLELYQSRTWMAYKRYIIQRIRIAEESLYGIDPYKETTTMARNQGIRIGLMDLEGYLKTLSDLKERSVGENIPGGEDVG